MGKIRLPRLGIIGLPLMSPSGVLEPPVFGILEPGATRVEGTIEGFKLERFWSHWQDAGASPEVVVAALGNCGRRAPGSTRCGACDPASRWPTTCWQGTPGPTP